MKFHEVFRFEVRHLLTRPSTWLYALLLLAVPLLLVNGGADPVGTGTVFNAPLKIAWFTLFIGLLGTLVTAALFVEAGSRDVRWRMEPHFHTTPLLRSDYLGGRFAGVLLVNALLLLAVPAGLMLSIQLQAETTDTLGPFRVGTYLLPYLWFLLPNLLVNAAVLYGVTVLTRRSLPGYLGGLTLMAAYLITVNLFGRSESHVAALPDPTGGLALTTITSAWTRVEQNSSVIGLQGVLLWNRLVWLTLGAGMLAFTGARFRLAHAEPRSGRLTRERDTAASAAVGAPGRGHRETVAVVPAPPRSSGATARARQVVAVALMGFRQTVFRPEFILVTAGFAALALTITAEATNDSMFGTPLWPLTQEVVSDLAGRVVHMLIVLLTIFYAGELVWREREAGFDRISDSVPVPDWVTFAGKFLALALMIVLLQAVLTTSAMFGQALHGYPVFEPGLYLRIMFGLQLADYLLLAALAVLTHVLINHKYAGHVIAALLFVGIMQSVRFGIRHNLLIYGSDAGSVYSDLNGFGPGLAPFIWFKVYWAGWALLLAMLALLFWVRGTEIDWRARLQLARRRMPRVAPPAAAAALLVIVTGGFIFYNTNVLNEYRTGWNAAEVLAEHERRYSRFEHAPAPWLTAMRLDAEVYADRREAVIRGAYRLVNRTGATIDTVHVSTFPNPQVTLRNVRFDRAAQPLVEDAAHGYRIYGLGQALQPGDSLLMQFEVRVTTRGFRNSEPLSANTPLVGDFTHLPSLLVLPGIGYQRELLELSSARERHQHGLPPTPARPSIHDTRAQQIPRIAPNADWLDFEATVSTAPGQIAVLPGTLQRSWIADGRRHFHYRSVAPITASFALLSAAWAVHEARWNGVDIRILHDPAHSFNAEAMVSDLTTAFEYLTEHFGSYPHRQFRMIEFPRYGNFGRAYPGMLLYTENNFIALARRDAETDYRFSGPLLLTAHELAHQWWGQHVLGADVQGSQVLSETLAQYSAVMVLQHTHGEAAARAFLRSMHMSYVENRGSHPTPEVPLLFTGNHEYIHYRKGPVVMYALQDHIGEARMNRALRNLIRNHGGKGPPYATSLDLYRELEAVTPDSLQYLLRDLFTSITVWDLRATAAHAVATGNGEYRVTLDVEAFKLRSDSVGNHTRAAMNDLIDIAVFGDDGKPLYLRRHRIASGAQSITVVVQENPARAGIDPYHKLPVRHRDALLGSKVVPVENDGVATHDRPSRLRQ